MKMHSKVIIFLIGTAHIYYQVLAQDEDIYSAELMVESNVTLEAQTVLSALNISDLSVTDSNRDTYTVKIVSSEMVAECLIIGTQSNCSCSAGYLWSNDVCYSDNCCSPTPCLKNVSYTTPLCVPAVNVTINGSVQSSYTLNPAVVNPALTTAFQKLNALVYVNITGPRTVSSPNTLDIMDFEVLVNVRLNSSKFQDILNGLQSTLTATIFVDTVGMVTIEAPQTQVCYLSVPELRCTFEEATDSAGWNLTTANKRFELNDGSIVKQNTTCATGNYQSCIGVKLVKVTGIWKGIYECGFTVGSIRHTARAGLDVALLPDVITMKANPLTADCTQTKLSAVTVSITVTAEISPGDGIYNVTWSYNGSSQTQLSQNSKATDYSFSHLIKCEGLTETLVYFNITFINNMKQNKSARLDIPVILAGAPSCKEDTVDYWPKTPGGGTVINQSCPDDKVGFRSRTCEGSVWQPVFSKCVSKELSKVSDAADNFLKGLGATSEVAKDIFEGLKNSSLSSSGSDIADVGASINVLQIMAKASNQTELKDNIFPDFVSAASNMLNGTWSEVNNTMRYKMSSEYLTSVDGLVKNIKVNQSNEVNSTNLDLKFCQRNNCSVSVFDVGVNMNKTDGILKTVAVKNLMSKLNNTFNGMPSDYTNLVLSATLDNNSDSTIQIRVDFPSGKTSPTQYHCVFWNTAMNEWSDEGCNVSISDGNHTVCQCNHLTAFSVLMSKNDISDPILEVISNVGLGVSICSLVIFLIIEFLVWSAVVKSNLSHFRHTAIVNIATFLLLANICFLASGKPETLPENWCFILTICKHLFYLAMFCWMLCLSVMLVHQLIFVFSPLRKRVFMFLSSILGYVCPILIVGASYVYYKYTNSPYYKKETCWLVFDKLLVGSMHAFLLPVGTIILTNLFSMIVVMVTLLKTSVPDSSKADDKDTAKSILKVVIFLTPVFGVTWIVGFFQLMLKETDSMFKTVTYIFTILNSFQGLFILITGCFGEQKVREELLKLIMGKSKGNDSTKKFTSTTYTKDN